MTSARLLIALMIPVAYLLGSIPFGLVVGLWRGIDPRKAGSGNIGATNVGRLLGGRYFALVFILDMLKGTAAVLLHMFSIFLGFKGGKGVATSAGVMLGMFPYFTYPGLAAIVAFIVLFMMTRYVSVGSMGAAMFFPVAYLVIGRALGWDVLGAQLPLLVFAVVVAVLIVYKHRTNITRLMAGTESRFVRS